MKKNEWTYALRLLGGSPATIPMDRLGEYISVFAQLLGEENHPTFKAVVKGSVTVRARTPEQNTPAVNNRLQVAKSDPDSKPAKALHRLEKMSGEDNYKGGEVRNRDDNVIFAFGAKKLADSFSLPSVQDTGEIDGIVIGISGADDTIHIAVRDSQGRDIRLITRDIGLSKELALRFRGSEIRFYVHGAWVRYEDGWRPETGKAYLDHFEDLEGGSLVDYFRSLRQIKGNGWAELENPQQYWEDLRGSLDTH